MGVTEAVRAVEQRAGCGRSAAEERWIASIERAGALDDWVDRFQRAGRLTLNFHPDRIARGGLTVAAGLAAEGTYRTQWMTGISAGSRSAIDGGERQRFERELFDGAYDDAEPLSGDHPAYGSLDLLFDEHGGSPRFGSSYLVVASHVRPRTTLCVGDSHTGPRDVGTFDRPWGLLAGLGEQASRCELLNRDLGPDALLSALDGSFRLGRASRDLDGYIEVQVHGGVSLANDVEAVVVDPSFCGTDVGRQLSGAATRFGFELRWHSGSELAVDDVPADFRGPTMPSLARRVAGSDGIVHARAIGVAAVHERFEEPTLSGDPPGSALQQLKYLWHTVVAHGRDATPRRLSGAGESAGRS
ncbi:MAG: DUF3626 domain-containing protein [Acidimicrobiales bacterium]